MDELSPLFHDIEFNERFRGYDVDEVDAYVDRVAKAAALVQGRIAELQDRVAAAEARPATVVSAEPPLTDDGSLARVLVLAQRTADAAIEEAKAEAESLRQSARTDADLMRREADDHASLVLAEAETDRRRIVADAEAQASAVAASERDRIATEIAELERYRAFLNDDIVILETHLADSRLAVAASVSALSDLIERPETFRTAAMPATSGVDAPLAPGEPLTPAEHDPDPEPEPVAAVHAQIDTDPTSTGAGGDDPEPAGGVDPVTVASPADPADLHIEPEPTQPIEVISAELIEDAPAPDATVEAEPVESAAGATDDPTEASVDLIDGPADPVDTIHGGEAPDIDTAASEPVAAEPPFDVEQLTDPEPSEAVAGPAAFDDEPIDIPGSPSTEVVEPEPAAEPAAVDLSFDFDLDLTSEPTPVEASVAEPEEIVDLTDSATDDDHRAGDPLSPSAAPTDRPDDTGSTATLDRPRLVTSEDLEGGEPTMVHETVESSADAPTVPPADDEFLFADPEPTANDHFLEQLRDAVNTEETPDEFGEDALAAFFDDGDDDDNRGWFNRRR